MNPSTPPPSGITAAGLSHLNGKVVLVKSTRDRRNPPTAMRGTIEVQEIPGKPATVRIAVEFPQMFQTTAHHRTIGLDDASVAQLLRSERNGTFEYTIDDELV